MVSKLLVSVCGIAGICSAGGASAPFRTADDGRGGVLGYAEGTKLLEADGLRFKDLNRNGKLDPYEDWRLGADARAKDLAAKLPLDDIFGLMLYSPTVWLDSGKISKEERKFLVEDKVRHVLVGKVASPRAAAEWNNAVQALVERTGMGVPANNASDPRHQPVADVEYSPGAGGKISMWPGFLAMAATFDPEVVRAHAEIAAQEYRALGIATALSPQADIATEPRWRRFNQTYGESPELATEMVRAYGDGFQTTPGAADGWGRRSVNAMVKHWPGGGSGEAGRDAHFGRGKFAVYPGGGLARQKQPFVDGAFALKGATKMCSAVMPYYTIAWGQTRENLANGFSHEMIQEQLRDALGYDGVVCTDWAIVHDEPHPNKHGGKPWGMDYATVAERHLKCWLAGVDQFGGCNEAGPVREAFAIGCKRHGTNAMERIVRKSAARLLRNIFRTGLFENPYVDPEATAKTVGCGAFMKAGYEAQVKSVVMVKNHGGALPLKGGKALKVYVPERTEPAHESFWGRKEKAKVAKPVAEAIVAKFFTPVASAAEADAAVVFVRSPLSGWGYSEADAKAGGNGYVPISLQYEPYTAAYARAKSIAGGDKFELSADRSYRGKTVTTSNATDLEQVLRVRRELGPGKPLVVVLNVANPTVPDKMEQAADAFLVVSDIQNQAVFDILSGAAEPSGLLPFQMPADMRTVEEQCEDLPYDMRPYVDADGNAWDFAFGLNWSGRIDDARTRRAARWRTAPSAAKGGELAPLAFETLAAGSIRPGGWLKRLLEVECEGLPGRLNETGKLLKPDNGWLKPGAEWGWEEQPYWLRTCVKLAALTENERLMGVSREWIEGVISTARPDGWFGPEGLRARTRKADGKVFSDIWPHMVMTEALLTWYDLTLDRRVIDVLRGFVRWCASRPDDVFLKTEGDWQTKVQCGRACDLVPSLFRLYELTGDASFLALADRLFRMRQRTPDKTFLTIHNVNFAQRFAYETVFSRRSGNPSHRAFADYWYEINARLWGGEFPRGAFAADECQRAGCFDARYATESCCWGELIRSFRELANLTGEVKWCDRTEDIVFNWHPVAYSPDWKRVHYLTAANMVNVDATSDHNYMDPAPRIAYSSQRYRCCLHNAGLALPLFAESLARVTPGGDLVFALYAPHAGWLGETSWRMETRYPFRETVSLEIAGLGARGVRLRVPGWAKGFSVKRNGQPFAAAAEAGRWLELRGAWGATERFEIEMRAECEFSTHARTHAVTVERGPLAYSLELGERYRDVPAPKFETGADGATVGVFPAEKEGEKGERMTEVLPTRDWNYALVRSKGLEYRERAWSDDCFVASNAVCEIVAAGRKVPEWTLQDGEPAALQESPVATEAPEEELRFIPMGAARCRLTVLPVAAEGGDLATRWQPVPAATKRSERPPLISQ